MKQAIIDIGSAVLLAVVFSMLVLWLEGPRWAALMMFALTYWITINRHRGI